MDRTKILDEIAAAGRRISEMIEDTREVSDDHDFDLSNRLQAEIRRLHDLCEQLLGEQRERHRP